MKFVFKIFIPIFVFISCIEQVEKEQCKFEQSDLEYGLANKYGYSAYHELDKAQNCSKQTDRPIFILFTGYQCHSSQDVPWQILQDTEIKALINKNYILTTLYVDDRSALEHNDTMKLKSVNDRPIETVGDKNLYFEINHFQSVIQPIYAIVDSDLNILTESIGLTYLEDKNVFLEFLQRGIK